MIWDLVENKSHMILHILQPPIGGFDFFYLYYGLKNKAKIDEPR
jgi:hypothetical protein